MGPGGREGDNARKAADGSRLSRVLGATGSELAIFVLAPCPHRAMGVEGQGELLAGCYADDPAQTRHLGKAPVIFALPAKLAEGVAAPRPNASVGFQEYAMRGPGGNLQVGGLALERCAAKRDGEGDSNGPVHIRHGPHPSGLMPYQIGYYEKLDPCLLSDTHAAYFNHQLLVGRSNRTALRDGRRVMLRTLL